MLGGVLPDDAISAVMAEALVQFSYITRHGGGLSIAGHFRKRRWNDQSEQKCCEADQKYRFCLKISGEEHLKALSFKMI